jgi:hypothetical protein
MLSIGRNYFENIRNHLLNNGLLPQCGVYALKCPNRSKLKHKNNTSSTIAPIVGSASSLCPCFNGSVDRNFCFCSAGLRVNSQTNKIRLAVEN